MAKDFPFDECAEAAFGLMLQGWTVRQKFTCGGCGARQTMDEPNRFFEFGTCEECHHTTNLKLRGCNYSVMKSIERL